MLSAVAQVRLKIVGVRTDATGMVSDELRCSVTGHQYCDG